MKNWFRIRFFALVLSGLLVLVAGAFYPKAPSATVVISARGSQPTVAVAPDGSLHVAFGYTDKIFYASSLDSGRTFTAATEIATLPDMHLGMTRGPQITVTTDFVVVANVTKQGRNGSVASASEENLYVWQQNNTIWAKTTSQLAPVQVGTGTYPRAVKISKSNVVIYEANQGIVARQVFAVNFNKQ